MSSDASMYYGTTLRSSHVRWKSISSAIFKRFHLSIRLEENVKIVNYKSNDREYKIRYNRF